MNPTLTPRSYLFYVLGSILWDENDPTHFEAELLEVTDPALKRGNEAPVKV